MLTSKMSKLNLEQEETKEKKIKTAKRKTEEGK